jgi:hypothetical protein
MYAMLLLIQSIAKAINEPSVRVQSGQSIFVIFCAFLKILGVSKVEYLICQQSLKASGGTFDFHGWCRVSGR